MKNGGFVGSATKMPDSSVAIYVDSQAAIKALASIEVGSRPADSCRSALRELSDNAFAGFPGTMVTMETKQRMSAHDWPQNLSVDLADGSVDIPLRQVKGNLEKAAIGIATASWIKDEPHQYYNWTESRFEL